MSLTDCSCVHHLLLSKVRFDHLPSGQSLCRQRTCSDSNRWCGPCVLQLNLHTLKLCSVQEKKKVLGNSLFLCVRYYCLIPPPFEMKFRVVLAAWNASRPEEALFPQLLYWGNLQRLSPCYLWHGGQGDISSNNFASCVWDSLVTVAKNSTAPPKMIILY